MAVADVSLVRTLYERLIDPPSVIAANPVPVLSSFATGACANAGLAAAKAISNATQADNRDQARPIGGLFTLAVELRRSGVLIGVKLLCMWALSLLLSHGSCTGNRPHAFTLI